MKLRAQGFVPVQRQHGRPSWPRLDKRPNQVPLIDGAEATRRLPEARRRRVQPRSSSSRRRSASNQHRPGIPGNGGGRRSASAPRRRRRSTSRSARSRRARSTAAQHPGLPGGPWPAAARSARVLLYNPRLRRAYRIEDGIPVLLVDEAVTITDDAEHQRLCWSAPKP